MLDNISTMSRNAQQIYEKNLKLSNMSIDLKASALKMQSQMRDIILIEDEKEIRNKKILMDALDKEIVNNLNTIKETSKIDKVVELEEQIRNVVFLWKSNREELYYDKIKGKSQEAINKFNSRDFSSYIIEIENKLAEINSIENNNADNFMMEIKSIEKEQLTTLAVAMFF